MASRFWDFAGIATARGYPAVDTRGIVAFPEFSLSNLTLVDGELPFRVYLLLLLLMSTCTPGSRIGYASPVGKTRPPRAGALWWFIHNRSLAWMAHHTG